MFFPEKKFRSFSGALHLLVLVAFVLSLTIQPFAQKRIITGGDVSVKQAVAPELVRTFVDVGGNPTCQSLNANEADFPTINSDWGLKINRDTEPPFAGDFYFVNDGSNGTELQGGAIPQPDAFVTIDAAGNTMDWFATNMVITAVIVKGGNQGARVYVYDPASDGSNGDGDGLTTPNTNGISHIVFCFEPQAGPSAAPAAAGGRVVDSFGRGISGATVTVQNAFTGERFTTYSSPFGYYVFPELESSYFYFMTVSHKRYTFGANSRTFTLNDNMFDLDFVANP